MITRGSTQCMSDCNHEEADTRIIVHLQDAIANGEPVTALIRTVDTDVVVILIDKFFNLKRINQNVQVWVAFGMGKSFRYLSINGICAALGEQKSRAPYQCLTPFVDVTPHQLSMGRGSSLLGRPGHFVAMLSQHF